MGGEETGMMWAPNHTYHKDGKPGRVSLTLMTRGPVSPGFAVYSSPRPIGEPVAREAI